MDYILRGPLINSSINTLIFADAQYSSVDVLSVKYCYLFNHVPIFGFESFPVLKLLLKMAH